MPLSMLNANRSWSSTIRPNLRRVLSHAQLERDGYDVHGRGRRAGPVDPQGKSSGSGDHGSQGCEGRRHGALAPGARARRQASRHDHRARHRRQRGRGAEDGRFRLPDQALRPSRSARHRAQGAHARSVGRRSHAPRIRRARVAHYGIIQRQHSGAVRGARSRRGHADDRAHHWRKRHRQGARRARVAQKVVAP